MTIARSAVLAICRRLTADDLTEVIEMDGDEFVVLWSPETAEHEPRYSELGRFPTRAEAEAFLATG
jgi:hypothetical protein